MARLFISRMLETFFRRWWLYLIPIVLLLGLGVFTVLGAPTKYRSTGVIRITDFTAANLGALTPGNDFGTDTPAAYTARDINTLLATDAFLDLVIANAEVRESVDTGVLTRSDIRGSVGAGEVGDVLLSVGASTSNPELSLRLANSTITSYKQWESGNIATDSAAYVKALEERVADQESLIAEIEGEALVGDSLDAATDELGRLEGELESARSAARQSTSNIDAQLELIDEPEMPTSPTSSRKEDVQTLVLFLVLGGLVSAAAVVVGTLLDRSVRYGEEIELRLHVPVLATVPDSHAARAPLVV